MSAHIIILSTVSNDVEAAKIARELVGRRLAACVNIVPAVRSIYRWKGKVHDDSECMLVIKTVRERFESVRLALCDLHSYDLPEVVALPIDAGDDSYLNWLTDQSVESLIGE